MTNVIQFGKPPGPDEDLVFKCGECGCTSFLVMQSGAIECTCCDTIPPNGWWKPESVITRLDADTLATQIVTRDDFAKRRAIQRAEEHDSVVIVAMKADGVITTWHDSETIGEDAEDWMGRQMIMATAMLRDEPIADE